MIHETVKDTLYTCVTCAGYCFNYSIYMYTCVEHLQKQICFHGCTKNRDLTLPPDTSVQKLVIHKQRSLFPAPGTSGSGPEPGVPNRCTSDQQRVRAHKHGTIERSRSQHVTANHQLDPWRSNSMSQRTSTSTWRPHGQPRTWAWTRPGGTTRSATWSCSGCSIENQQGRAKQDVVFFLCFSRQHFSDFHNLYNLHITYQKKFWSVGLLHKPLGAEADHPTTEEFQGPA